MRRREQLAARMGGEERVARQHASGRLTVRERLELLLDPGTWRETGGLAGVGSYDDDGRLVEFAPSTMVVGQGEVDGSAVVVQGDDFTVKGGAGDDAVWRRMTWAERAAHDLRRPLVRLVDGTGGGGSVKTLASAGYAAFPSLAGGDLAIANLSRVPVVAAALGPCAGLGAARVVQSHFSVIVRGTAQLFIAGPPVVAWAMSERPDKEELGGARAQVKAGAVDNEAANEEDAMAQLKRFLSYLPPNVWTAPPVHAATDPVDRREEELLSIVPRDERRTYKMRRIVELVFDRGSVFELGARFGRSTITALARLDGKPVGVIASDPTHYGGGLTASAAEKQTRFVDMCDQFRLPVVNLVDQPGFVVGTESERAGTMRRGSRLIAAVMQARTPWCSIIVRKCFGIAGAAHGDGSRLNLRYAWPSGSWGSLPIAGGLEAAYRRELEAAEDPVALRAEIEAHLRAVTSPFRTAERFSIEHVIDPRDTRRQLCLWAAQAYDIVRQDVVSEEPIRRRGLRP
ncbi:acyl-CoA carboxylase subunit beta [Conexibacter sp. CPCC 206217]|uniref:acyl-CoA carboxylase subunit beta n=1 Tax=Conexibacter sp. CPCC 206217 TaxID=3064574 RepID=UPI00351C574E